MDREAIRSEVFSLLARRQEEHPSGTAWGKPLVGFASADDQLFRDLKKAVSPTHALPHDLLPSARAVVAYFIPLGRPIGRSNVKGASASREWAQAYIDTNELIGLTGSRLKALLEAEGHDTAFTPATHNFDPVRLISDWSHRHVAYVAGLGRFGVNNMLITDLGCCGRFGSFVTSLALEADPRPEGESCLHRHGSDCLRCVERCVGGALFPDRFDRHACHEVCKGNAALFRALGKADVCGKCLVGLPCTWTNPVKAASRPGHGDARA